MLLHYKAQIYCMFILAVLFFMCLIGIKHRSRENKIFNWLLVFAMVNMVFDISSNYTVNHLETVSVLVNRIVHICFFLSMTTLFLLVYKYLVALIEKELGRNLKGKFVSNLPYIFLFVIVLFLPIYYMIEETGNYSYGPGPNMVYACVAIYVILIVELIIRHRKNISGKNKVAIILALVCELSAAFFQMFNPAALTSSLGVTLLCLCMYMTVANPDAVLVGLLKEETARADAANKAKSDFLARISHEIRTPINVVLGMDEIILRESKEKNVKKYAKDIKSAANSLLSIINDILDSSKIESGKMEIVPVEYEMDSLLNDIYNMMVVKANDKGLSLVFEIDENIPVGYYGDDVRIKQVLMNLLNNAIKYTEKGTVTLSVKGRREGENEILSFNVLDTGIGIKEEDIEKIFEKFERVDEARNHNIEGTGLGINIVISLLRLMESDLKVVSQYGKGSDFGFELVQKIVNDEKLGNLQERIENIPTEYQYDVKYIAPDAKILIVDDNEMNIKVFKNLIKQLEVKVYEALSGSQCLEMMKNQKFDMIFLDHMMPEMDGIETFKIMKEKNLNEGVPVIMLTANAVKGAKEMYIGEGFTDFLSKPIIPDKLEKMIKDYLPNSFILEKDIEKNQIIEDNKSDNLSKLDEFDFEYALKILGSEEMLMETLHDFMEMTDSFAGKLSDYAERIDEPDMVKAYRIEVHSLKSSAATIGAILLSKLARLLEVAAIECEIDKIKSVNPILIEEVYKHKARIATLFAEKKEPITNMKMIISYVDMLKASLINEDYGTADFVCGGIDKYQFEGEAEQLVVLLKEKVMNLEGEKALEVIDKLKNILGESV